MAQRDYTLDLKSAGFPLLSERQPRTIMGGGDKATPGAIETPGLYYCHNVMPSMEGLDSVSFKAALPVTSPATAILNDVRGIHSLGRTRMHMAWDTEGRAYYLEEGDTYWTQLADTVPPTINIISFPSSNVTLGTVNGVTYIWYKGVGCFVFNEATHRLESVTLTGISIFNTVGISDSSGYLIAYTTTAVAWSSTVDPTDFTPSSVTGAGGGNVAEAEGDIKFILSNSLGILIYADANTVAGVFTGNVQYPFKLREVSGSTGGVDLDQVAYESTAATQFCYSKAGLQALTSQKAETILPEVTSFLAGKRFEDFDEVTGDFTITDLTTTMKKKLKFVASRYLIISYGITEFTHALIYDIALKRLGKIKFTHVDCFEYLGNQLEVSRESIAFALNTGEVKTLDFSVTATDSSGVVILGKLQYSRGRQITLQGVTLENITSDADLSVIDLAAIDGKNTSKIAGFAKYSAENLREYSFRATATNHSLLLIGRFNLNTCYITYTLSGRR